MVKRANPRDVARQVAKEVVASNGHIEVSVGEIVAMRDSMMALMKKPLPARSSFRLVQLANVLNPHLEAYQAVAIKLVQEVKEKYIREGREPLENSMEYAITDDDKAEIKAQIDALSAEMVEVPSFKIVLPATIEIEAQYLMPLERFLEVAE